MKRALFITIIFLFIVFLYAKYVEPTKLVVNEYGIHNTKIPKGFNGTKIIHFSDLLYRDKDDNDFVQQIINKINEQKPDIIVFTGDLLNVKLSNEDKTNLINFFEKTNAPLGKFYIIGDRDTDQAIEILDSSGFIHLDNSSHYLFKEDTTPILITGGNDLSEENLLNEEDINYDYIISLLHKPDDYDKIKNINTSLVLAGHSLGGQIRVPFWGALIKDDGAQKYTDNYYKIDNTNLYVSFGLGTGKLDLRFFNKPSINVYRLYSK